MCSRRSGIEIILKQEGRSNECPSVEMGSVVAVFECRKARKSNVVELSTRFVRSIVVGHYSEIHCISDIVTMEKVTIVTIVIPSQITLTNCHLESTHFLPNRSQGARHRDIR